jgi:hypothetical protein
MALMMLGEQEPARPVRTGREVVQLLCQQMLREQLFAQPQRQRHPERADAARRERKVGLQQPLELKEGFVVERDEIDLVGAAGRRQAMLDRVARKVGVLLLAGEAFLLDGGDDLAVGDEGCRTVVIERGYAEDLHPGGLRTACR